MCYLPLGCLKFIVGVGAVSSIFISLGLLALTIYANVQKKQIINNTGGEVVTSALVGLYLGAVIFMVLGICGVYGAIKARKKQKNSGNCLLSLYLIGVFFFLIIFIGGTIFFFVGPITIFGTNCTHGGQTNLVEQLYNLTNDARDKFCTTNCPCYINSTNEGSYLANWLNNNGRVITTTNNTLTHYQSCLPSQNATSSNVVLMGALEQLLECAGWCPDENIVPRFYRFYDINACVSEDCINSRQPCHTSFENFLKTNGQLIGAACAIATLVCLINVITVCCICYHPSKRRRGSNFYDRMMDQN